MTGSAVLPSEEKHMADVYILAIDLAKRSFQVYATDRGGAVLYNRGQGGDKVYQ